jgi:hypothetical protein
MINRLTLFRRSSYKKTFDNPEGKKVLADLKRFCKATVPTADLNNEKVTYLLEGRREVWLRIQAHLQLTEDEIYQLLEDYPNE